MLWERNSRRQTLTSQAVSVHKYAASDHGVGKSREAQADLEEKGMIGGAREPVLALRHASGASAASPDR